MTTTLLIAALATGFQAEAPNPAAGDLPTPTELFATYRANFHTFRTLSVQLRRDHAYAAAYLAREAKELAALEKSIDAIAEGAPEAERLRQELVRRQQGQASRTALGKADELFETDRKRFLMRTAPLGWDVGRSGDPPAMPNVALTESSLRTIYADYALVSYPEPLRGGFHQVTYMGQYGQVSAMIRRQFSIDGRSEFPPLATEGTEWGPFAPAHPLDAFFRDGPNGFRTVGREAIDGRDAVLIERRTEVGNPGQPRAVAEIVRAWLDPERGALPLKIEWTNEPIVDEKVILRPSGSEPDRRLTTTDIQPIGDGYYPMRGKIEVFGIDPEAGAANAAAPRLVMETTTWTVGTIRANQPLPATLTTIPIPKDTYYYDEFSGRSLRAGYDGSQVTRLPWMLCGGIVAGWLVYGLIALTRSALARRSPAGSA